MEQKLNAKIAEYMGVGIYVDHTEFINEFPLAIKEFMRENQGGETLVKTVQEVKEAIQKFSYGQMKTFLETVEKAIEEKDEEEPFPEMPEKVEKPLYFGYKMFSDVLNDFVNSK
uniref:CdiI_2 domain-containing protein n=1 Tax=Meloidogyne hapla TaxID=6305 RepID=A0A1I8BN40_MELHA